MFAQLLDFLDFTRPRNLPPPSTQLLGESIMLRLPDMADWRTWSEVRRASREFLSPWEPRWDEKTLSHKFFINYVHRAVRDWRADKTYTFLILRRDAEMPNQPIGGITLTEVRRDVISHATMGYWMGKDFAGHGYMREAAQLVTRFAFDPLGLDELHASCMPHNEISKRVLSRLGFIETGFAFRYLQINGRLEDHLLWKLRQLPPTQQDHS